MKRPTAKTTAPVSSTAGVRPSPNCRWTASEQTSSMLMREVTPAKSTDRKKSTAKSRPAGICAKTLGSVMKMRGGPACGSRPKAKTAGMTAMPATSAAAVSSRAVRAEAWGMSSVLER